MKYQLNGARGGTRLGALGGLMPFQSPEASIATGTSERRLSFPDGPTSMRDGRAFLHRIAMAEIVNTYMRGPLDLDNLTGETWEMRIAYRKLMLKEPAVKAALFSKIQAVANLDPQVLADDDDEPADKAAANFVSWAIERSFGGWPKLIETIATPMLIDGFGVSEPLYKIAESRKYKCFWTLDKLYSCDTQFVRFDIDNYKQVQRIRFTKTQPVTYLDPRDFVIVQHLPLFESPFGISDLRAAYRAANLIESAIKLRAILLENFSGPYLVGKYPAGDQGLKANMEDVLPKARSLGWACLPVGAELEVIDLAQKSNEAFQSAIDDLRKEIYTAIRGAYLPFTEASAGVERGDTSVQKSITEIFELWLANTICEAINSQIIPGMVRPNYGSVGMPRVQLGGMSLERAAKQLNLIKEVHELTGDVSKKQVYDLSRVEPAKDDEDRLPPPQQPGGGPGGGGPPPGSNGPPHTSRLVGKHMHAANGKFQPQAGIHFFDQAGEDRHPVTYLGPAPDSPEELVTMPNGWPPAGEFEGRKLASILQPSIDAVAKSFVRATEAGVKRGLKDPADTTLFTGEERARVVDSLAALLALSDILARGRLCQNRPDIHGHYSFADAVSASAGFDLFGASGDVPFNFITEPPRAFGNAGLAIEYITGLVPIPGVDPLFMAQGFRRRAFTLAVAAESDILAQVKESILDDLHGISEGRLTIRKILGDAGCLPENPQYPEMVARTNAMDAYDTGLDDLMQDPRVQEDFPAWLYCGIRDGREGDDHRPQFDKIYPASVSFKAVRGPRKWNCRCLKKPLWKGVLAKMLASGALIEDGPPTWTFSDLASQRMKTLTIVAGQLADEIAPSRLRVILGHLADDPEAFTRAAGIPPATAIFHGKYDETLHPRDDHGRWIDKADIASARTNSAKANELRARTTNPQQRAKLDKLLGSSEPLGGKPSDTVRGKGLVAKAKAKAATPTDQRELFDHLPALDKKDVGEAAAAAATDPRQQGQAAAEQQVRVADHVRDAAAGAVPMPPHPVHAMMTDAIGRSSNLTNQQKQYFGSTMASVLGTMPTAAHDRIAANLKSVGFHGSIENIGSAAVASALDRDFIHPNNRQDIENKKQMFAKGYLKPAAAYLPNVGKLHINGDSSDKYPVQQVYAHALAHVIDGPKHEFSSSPEWERAWNADIAGKLSEAPKLNKYARGNPSEGFAEFARLVFGTEHPAGAIEAKFPLASAVFKAKGLWSQNVAPPEPPPPVTAPAPAPAPATTPEEPPKPGEAPSSTPILPYTPHAPLTPALTPITLPEVFGERIALDHKPDGAHVDTLAPTVQPNGTPVSPENQHVYTVPTKSLHIDPTRFQYKVAGIGEGGVGKELSKVNKWNPNLGGVALVWRDPKDGKDYVVNGHHRHELAGRVGQPEMNVRYIDAKDPIQARAIGALANIAEGRGKAIDAAKYMRDTKQGLDHLKQAGLSMSTKIVNDAAALTNLGPKSFQAVTEGRLDEDTAVAVAKHLEDPEKQDLLFSKIRQRENDGRDWTSREIEVAAKKLASSGATTAGGSGDLFGDIMSEQSTFDQEVDLESFASRKLAQQITDYSAVGNKDRAGRVSEAGNQLNLEENARRRKAASDLTENFEKFARLKSNTSATIKKYAAELASSKDHKWAKDDVRNRFYADLQQAVADDIAGKPVHVDAGAGAGSGSGEPAAPATDAGRSEPAADQNAAGLQPAAVEPPAPAEAPADEQARRAEVSALLEPQGPADAATEADRPAGADGVLGNVGASDAAGDTSGRDGNQPAGDGATPPDVAPVAEEPPITTHLPGAAGATDIATQQRARSEFPTLSNAYLAKGLGERDADGTLKNVMLNTDEWRDLFPEYKGTNAADVHAASSYLNKKLYHQALEETSGKGNKTMLILAGGGGSGKGSAVKDHIRLSEYPLTLDQVSDNYKSLQQKMDQAKANGFATQFAFIDRKPESAWLDGVVKRAMNARSKGELARTVPLEVALHANIEARKTALKYLQENPDAEASVVDNNRGPGEARLIMDRNEAIQFLKTQDAAHNYDELLGRLRNDTLDLHESGGLPADIAAGLVGEAAIHDRRAQSGRPAGAREDGAAVEPAAGAVAGAGTEGTGAASVPRDDREDIGATSDEQLRRKAPESAEPPASDHLSTIKAIPEGKSATINGVEVRHGSNGIYSATIDGKSVVDVAEGIVKRLGGETKAAPKAEEPKPDETKPPASATPDEVRARADAESPLVIKTRDGRTLPGPKSKPSEAAGSPAETPAYGDYVITEDGKRGFVEGSGGMGSGRVGVVDEHGIKSWHNLKDLKKDTDHVEKPRGESAGANAPQGEEAAAARPAAPVDEGKPAPAAEPGATAGDAPPAAGANAESNPHIAAANTLATKLKAGESVTAKDVMAAADAAHGGTKAAGKYGPSDAYDSLEAGFNKSIAGQTNPTQDLQGALGDVKKLEEKLNALPTQTYRSGNKNSFQQFSTPPHYAYAAAWLANLSDKDHVLEPSAGTGSLAVHAANAGAKLTLNELDPRRADFLKDQFGADNVHVERAEHLSGILPNRGVAAPTAVVMNPPFSQTAGAMGDKKDLQVGAKHIAEALQSLAPGGRLVAIVGRGMTPDSPTYREWFDKMKSQYNLRANVGVDGREYRKYGTNFGTRMLVFDKIGPHRGETVEGDAANIPDLMTRLEGVRNDRPTAHSDAPAQPVRKPVPASGAVANVPGHAAGAQPADRMAPADAAEGVPVAGQAVGPAGRSENAPAVGPGASDAAADAGLRNAGSGDDGGAGRAGATATPASVDDGHAARTPAAPDSGAGSKGVRRKSLQQPQVNIPELRKPERLAVSAKPTASGPGVSHVPAGEPVNVQSVGPKDDTGAGEPGAESLYATYKPANMNIPGMVPHTSPLVEPVALAAVQPPPATYRPFLSPDIIDYGKNKIVTNNPDGTQKTSDMGLSQAGLEAVVYAGQANEKFMPAAEGQAPRRRWSFIGDGTGSGKGREVAAILADNWNQGRKKAVWVSEKDKLQHDAKRDLADVGMSPDNMVHFADLRDGGFKHTEGIVFLPYSLLRSGSKKADSVSNVDQLINWLGKDFDGAIIFDESHNMGNADDTEGSRGTIKASEQALAALKLERAFPNARGAFVSATGATKLENLSYLDRLGIWGRGTEFANKADFLDKMSKGGMAGLEAVAQSLKARGLYTSRSLSYDGVEFAKVQHVLTPEDRHVYDTMATAWQNVLQNIDEVLDHLSGGEPDKAGQARGRAIGQFWGAQQRFFNQIMTSIQARTVIKEMEKDLAEGRSPVVSLVNTGGANLTRALKSREEGEDLEELDLSPKQILIQFLENSFPIHKMHEVTTQSADGTSTSRMEYALQPKIDPATKKPLLNAKGEVQMEKIVDPHAKAMRDNLLTGVNDLNIHKSPLDMVIHHFGHENVAEVTGRTRRLVYMPNPQTGKPELVAENREPKKANQPEVDAFQGGRKKVLIFNTSGGTGASYHADKGAANQARRVHYQLQMSWRADENVQMAGRTHRTNQVQPPIIKLAEIPDLPGQKRFVATTMRRFLQMCSLTRGQAKSSGSGIYSQSDNLESPEAQEGLDKFINTLKKGGIEGLDYQHVMKSLGLIRDKDESSQSSGGRDEAPLEMKKFLNRLLVLKVDDQQKVFNGLQDFIESEYRSAEENGTLDSGVENYPNATKITKTGQQLLVRDPEHGSETHLLQTLLHTKNKRVTFEESLRKGSDRQPVDYYTNNQSGQTWVAYKASPETDERTGAIHPRVLLQNATGLNGRAIRTEALEAIGGRAGSGYRKLDLAEAKQKWDAAHDAIPETSAEEEHFVTGDLLNVWGKLPQDRPKIYKLSLDDGTTVVGRHIPAASLDDTLKRIGVGPQAKEHKPEETFTRVESGRGTARLGNGWTLQRVRFGGELRVQLKPGEMGSLGLYKNELQGDGVAVVNHQYRDHYFLPTGPQGAEVLKRILAHRNERIVDVS